MMLDGTKITKVECLNNKKKDNVNITYKGFGEGPCKKKKKRLDDKKSVMYLLLRGALTRSPALLTQFEFPKCVFFR